MYSNTAFDSDTYKAMIRKSDHRAKAGFAVYTKMPTIAGTFTNWSSKEMIPIYDYCEYICRNRIPSTRYYIQPDGSMYNKLAQVLNQDIYKIIKTQFCIKRTEIPLLHKIRQKRELKEKMMNDELTKNKQAVGKNELK
jgi:hypothetical protein